MMGRAARHQHAKVLLYADRQTKALKHAIEETRRRRIIQIEYNRKHKICPQSVKKNILQSIEHVLHEQPGIMEIVKDAPGNYNLDEMILEMEKSMRAAAADLKFEEAARLRDRIVTLRGKTVVK